jgi:hypothetical protein
MKIEVGKIYKYITDGKLFVLTRISKDKQSVWIRGDYYRDERLSLRFFEQYFSEATELEVALYE